MLAEEGEEVGPGMEDLWYLQRLEGGLFTLQTVDYILAWVAMEDDGVGAAYNLYGLVRLMCLCRSEHIYNKCFVGKTNHSKTLSRRWRYTEITWMKTVQPLQTAKHHKRRSYKISFYSLTHANNVQQPSYHDV